MTLNKLSLLFSMGFLAGSIQWASAQPAGQTNYTWNGAGDGTSWGQAANWVGGVVPPSGGTTFQVFIGTGYPTTSPSPITVGASDVVHLNDAIFGPEWGQTLNIYGSVTAGFGIFAMGAAAQPQSAINLYGTGSFTAGDTLSLGCAWWFPGGPNVAMNLYDNAHATANYLPLGGHLNLYGGSMTVNNALLTGGAAAPVFSGGLDTDATRLVDLAGGQLIFAGDATAQVVDMIARGILQGYGVNGAVAVDMVSDPGHTIVIGVVPEPASVTLLGLGGLAGAFWVRRRRSAN